MYSLERWRQYFQDLGQPEDVATIDRMIAERNARLAKAQAQVDALAPTNPGSARLLARKLGLR